MSEEMWPRFQGWKASEARTRGLCKRPVSASSVSPGPSEGLVMRGVKQVWITAALGAMMRDDREKAGQGKNSNEGAANGEHLIVIELFLLNGSNQAFSLFFHLLCCGVSVVILYLLCVFFFFFKPLYSLFISVSLLFLWPFFISLSSRCVISLLWFCISLQSL